jgi:hypothetical protein
MNQSYWRVHYLHSTTTKTALQCFDSPSTRHFLRQAQDKSFLAQGRSAQEAPRLHSGQATPEVGDATLLRPADFGGQGWEMRRGKGKSAYALTSFVASAIMPKADREADRSAGKPSKGLPEAHQRRVNRQAGRPNKASRNAEIGGCSVKGRRQKSPQNQSPCLFEGEGHPAQKYEETRGAVISQYPYG